MINEKNIIESITQKILSALKSELHQFPTSQKLTRKEVVKLYKISLPTLLKYEKEGIIQGYRIGNRILFEYDDLEKSLTKRDFS